MRDPVLLIAVVLLVELFCPTALRGSPAATRPASTLVADGVAEDATSSNNQVKLIRDPSGTLLAAYVAKVADVPQIVLVQSRDGGRAWTAPSQASSGAIPSRLPALARDTAGRLHVVWTRYDDGVGKIYHRVWQDRWISEAERISPSLGYAGFPGLALDTAGRPHVVWYGIRQGSLPASSRHGSIYEIFYTGFDGRVWSPPQLISTGQPDSINPALAADHTGGLHAVWFQFDGRAYQVRYAERRAAWSEPDTVLATRMDAFNPDLAVGAGGQVVVAWEHHDGQASVVQVSQRNAGGWSDSADLSERTPPARHPSLAVAPSGVVYVVWDTDDGHVFARRFTTRWEPAVPLTSDGGNTYPSVASSGDGADVIWTHTAQGRSSVRYLRLGSGAAVTATPLVSRDTAWAVLVILLALAILARLRSRRPRPKAA